jgi:XTP/dITP diphosphohydrolase
MKILIASNNKHKVVEIKSILNDSVFQGIELITPKEISEFAIEVEENGKSFKENAEIKARDFFAHYKIPTLSDDSGLEVEILNGAPGIISARYSGINASDSQNRLKLIDEITKLGAKSSPAQFRCNICFFDGNTILHAEGICKGLVITNEKGLSGFGYDPLFIPESYENTFAELSEGIKNRISHRAIALSNFLPIFAKYYLKK